jgi:uncharacterized integral membrane protein (TIGR00697 family)
MTENMTPPAPAIPRREKVYITLACLFVTVLVLTNIIGAKLTYAFGTDGLAIPTGILTYPITFVVTDVVSEIYGRKRADYMVVMGFAMSILMLVLVHIAVGLEPHPAWVPTEGAYYESPALYQQAFESVFGFNAILVVGSMCAYLTAQLTDNYLFHFWKRATKGKYLWIRNNGSTMISQLVDTSVVGSIVFFIGFKMEVGTAVSIMVTLYVFKLMLAAIDTPITYLAVWGVRKFLANAPQEDELAA